MADSIDRTNPYLSSIKERFSLCRPGTEKETVHLELDIGDSDIVYEVGDSIGVFPSNPPQIVEKIIECLGGAEDELIEDPKTKELIPFGKFLMMKANLGDCTRTLLSLLLKRQTSTDKRTFLENILSKENTQLLKAFQSEYDVLDALELNREVTLSPQEFSQSVKPMLPRLYSIASSQRAVGNEVHLTIALQKWRAGGKERAGVCTYYLCELAPLNTPSVPIYIHKHRGFTLPEDSSSPIIMVGPGTGIAPFRAFMQEREILNAQGKNWLFFGEWNRFHHYFYEDYWQSLEQKGKLKVELAFSRDQADKVYVQHRLMENAEEIYRWLMEGAYFYVCGNASHMAKDVDATLLRIIMEQGNLSEEKAKEYIKSLRKENRYLKDVY